MSGLDDLMNALKQHCEMGGDSKATDAFIEEFGETARKDCALHLAKWGFTEPTIVRMRCQEKDKDEETFHPDNKFFIQVCNTYYRDDIWKINIILDWAENKIIKHTYQLVGRCKFKDREEVSYQEIIGDAFPEDDMRHLQWLFKQFSNEHNIKKESKNKQFEPTNIN